MNVMRTLCALLLFAAPLALLAQTSPMHANAGQPNGLFAQSTDIGLTQPGSVQYNPNTGTYTLTGGGADLWGTADSFLFDWRRHSGNGSLTASVAFPTFPPQPPNEKAILIFRASLDPGSAYVDVAIHADGHVTLQWRASQGAITQDITAPQRNPAAISIVRRGNHFTALAADPSGAMREFASIDQPLPRDLYLGLGVCAHDTAGLATIVFSKVRLTAAAK